MGIFYQRRLCLLCFVLTVSCWVAWFLPLPVLLIGGGALLLLSGAVLLCYHLRARPRKLLTVLLCLLFVLVALLQSVLRIELPERNARAYVGEYAVQAHVVEVSESSEYRTGMTVQLLRIGEDETRVRAYLTCAFPMEVAAGDTVYANAVLESTDQDRDGCLLRVTVEDRDRIALRQTSLRTPLETVRSDSGVWILSQQVRSSLRERLTQRLGERVGTLASAFLLGDRSELSDEINRDFQRAGVSHMMAVSGLHIAILLGSAELLLRKFYVPKRARCVIVAILGITFLFLTGFSLSACRSVLMLFFVYLYFWLQEGNDALTALFASIALILLLFPRAVTDLGMWMSFLATLGLLTVYPLCEARIKRSRQKGLGGAVLRLLRRVLLLALMTLIANFFLLPVIWIFFGEISLVAILANIVLSPISYCFLLGIPLFLAVQAIPGIGEGIALLLRMLGEGMIDLVGRFSRVPFATVSLNYDFCKILIPLFTVSALVLLTVRLRHKGWLALPPLLFVLLFAVCLTVTQLRSSDACVTYRTDARRNELLILTENGDFSVCDLTGGSLFTYREILNAYQGSTATEIDSVLLTHYHQGHTAGLELLMRQAVVRTLYLPVPTEEESRLLALQIAQLAEKQKTEVVLYDGRSLLTLTDSVQVQPQVMEASDAHPDVALLFRGSHTTLTYLSSGFPLTEAHLAHSSTLLFGCHGAIPKKVPDLPLQENARPKTVYYTHRALPQHSAFFNGRTEVYIPEEENAVYDLSFSLS